MQPVLEPLEKVSKGWNLAIMEINIWIFNLHLLLFVSPKACDFSPDVFQLSFFVETTAETQDSCQCLLSEDASLFVSRGVIWKKDGVTRFKRFDILCDVWETWTPSGRILWREADENFCSEEGLKSSGESCNRRNSLVVANPYGRKSWSSLQKIGKSLKRSEEQNWNLGIKAEMQEYALEAVCTALNLECNSAISRQPQVTRSAVYGIRTLSSLVSSVV